MQILSIDVETDSVVSEIESFIPEAKTGNLKDPAKIKAKQEEHREKFLNDALESTLFAIPCQVTAKYIPEGGKKPKEFKGPWVDFIEFGKKFLDDDAPLIVVGTHPTQHMRLLQNCVIRAQQVVPWFLAPGVTKVNPFREADPQGFADLDYPRIMQAYGFTPKGRVEDALAMAKLLGVF